MKMYKASENYPRCRRDPFETRKSPIKCIKNIKHIQEEIENTIIYKNKGRSYKCQNHQSQKNECQSGTS